jgi:hypothetical protein
MTVQYSDISIQLTLPSYRRNATILSASQVLFPDMSRVSVDY